MIDTQGSETIIDSFLIEKVYQISWYFHAIVINLLLFIFCISNE